MSLKNQPLTPEEEAIVAERQKRNTASSDLLLQAIKCSEKGDKEGFRKLMDEAEKFIPSMCEHGRSIWGSCIACHEIDVKLGFEEDD